MFGFLIGALAGVWAGYYWRENIRHYMSEGVPELRDRAADSLGTFGDRASGAMDRARARIDAAVRTGQERLRKTGRTRGGHPTDRMGFGAGNEPPIHW
jgi:hypothetical protein